MIKKISYIIGILLFSLSFSQKKEQLQTQNAELKKQIAQINNDLIKTRTDSKLSLSYLANVNQKLVLREKLYNNTHKEKKLIEDEIYLRQLEINRQNRELDILRKNYSKVLVNAYKNKGVQNKITFILSAKNLGEALRRVQYLRQYAGYQDKKAQEISTAAVQLKKSVVQKKKSSIEKENLLVNQKKELTTIEEERKQKELLLLEFKKNEARLTAELRKKQQQSKALEAQVRKIIAEEIKLAKAEAEANKKAEAEKLRLAKIAAEKEKAKIDAANKERALALEKERKKAEEEARKADELMAKRAEEERKRAAEAAKLEASARDEARSIAAKKAAEEATKKANEAKQKLAVAKAAEDALEKKKNEEKKAVETKAMTNFGVATNTANNFAANRGQLSMPAQGVITHRFGRRPHPVFKNIEEENNGIKISVAKGTSARAVYPGVVSSIISSADGTKAVMIRHGEYYTLYSNLSTNAVSKNQQVAAGTPLGLVAEEYDGTFTLEFQVWKGDTAMDPLSWVSQ